MPISERNGEGEREPSNKRGHSFRFAFSGRAYVYVCVCLLSIHKPPENTANTRHKSRVLCRRMRVRRISGRRLNVRQSTELTRTTNLMVADALLMTSANNTLCGEYQFSILQYTRALIRTNFTSRFRMGVFRRKTNNSMLNISYPIHVCIKIESPTPSRPPFKPTAAEQTNLILMTLAHVRLRKRFAHTDSIRTACAHTPDGGCWQAYGRNNLYL